MARGLYRIGRLVAGHAGVVVAVWLAAALGLTLVVSHVGAKTSNNLQLPGTGSQAATDLLTRYFPPQQNGTNPIIFHARSGKVTDKANKQAITDAYKAVKKIPYVYSAVSPFSQQGGAQLSKDKRTAFIGVLLKLGSNVLTEAQAERVYRVAAGPGQKAGMEVAAGGSIGTKMSPNDTSTSDVVGILAAMLILTLTFGTLVAMGMPIVTAIVGLMSALALIGLFGYLTDVPDIAHTIATMIGLAVGIDYALFMVTRHRTQMSEGIELRESIARAVGTAGTAIVFAGCTVVVALVSLAVAGIPLVAALGYTSAVAVAVAVLAAITLLPALMALAGPRINALGMPRFLRRGRDPARRGFWGSWAAAVTGHPWLSLAAAAVILAPLIVPVSSLRLGQEDIGQAAGSTMERRAFDLLAAGFGPGYNGPLQIATSIHPSATPDPKVTAQENQLRALQSELKKEQKQAKQMKAQLQQQSAELKREQSALEHQQAQLNAQAAQLQAQQASLESQQAALEAQAAALEQERNRLLAEARQLAASAKTLARQLVVITIRERILERRISNTTDPVRLARLEKRLARLQASEKQIRAALAADRKRAKALVRQARALEAQAAALRQQQAQLEAAAAQLQAQAAALQAQGAQLAAQAAELQRKAAALEKQKDDLLALQAKAKRQKAQAEKLHDELTKTLTKAGGDDRATDPRLVKLQDALIATRGDKLVSPPKLNKAGNAGVYTVVATTAPADPATASLVKTLRSSVIPQASGKGITAFVGGSTASNVDLAAEIADRLPLVIATILVVSMLVLLVAFRSLLIPLQAGITNLLTALASFGVLTACFQWGWGIGITGVETTKDTVPIASYVPLMMFAVLFGLSMDYQVFLLSQVEHHRGAGEGDRDAVASGLTLSARVIAAAALIMMAVFSSFILNGDPVVKQFGVGLSTAVALAGSMVLLLTPAVLTLTGRAAWWLPGWLGRVLPRIDIEGTNLDRPVAATPPEPAETAAGE
jgi:uncharacterized membrane protein YdfJ with MMPL/SSD domain